MRVVLTAAAAVLLAGCAAPPPAPLEIQMVGGEQGNLFEPGQFTIQAGQTATWRGQSGHHTVTFERPLDGTGVPPDSGDVGPGQTYTLTFPAAGTYAYRCRYHSGTFSPGDGMVGTIRVT